MRKEELHAVEKLQARIEELEKRNDGRRMVQKRVAEAFHFIFARRSAVIMALVLVALGGPRISLFAATINTIPFPFIAGTPIYASDVNSNFTTLYNNDVAMNTQLNGIVSSQWSTAAGCIYYGDWAGGNIGLGTWAPAYRLSVNGVSNSQIACFYGNTNGANYPTFDLGIVFGGNFSGGDAEMDIWCANNPAAWPNTGLRFMQLLTASTYRDIMFLKNNGNVGIGTTSPNQLLVVGSARKTYCNGTSWGTNGSDYAEYFENEEKMQPGDIVGIDLDTGKVRKYRAGDEFAGIVSGNAAFIGNDRSGERKNDGRYTLVGLVGQLDYNPAQVGVVGKRLYTLDGQKIGVLLDNGKVFIK